MSDPSKIETNQKLDPVAHDRQTALTPHRENAPPGMAVLRSGYALATSRPAVGGGNFHAAAAMGVGWK